MESPSDARADAVLGGGLLLAVAVVLAALDLPAGHHVGGGSVLDEMRDGLGASDTSAGVLDHPARAVFRRRRSGGAGTVPPRRAPYRRDRGAFVRAAWGWRFGC